MRVVISCVLRPSLSLSCSPSPAPPARPHCCPFCEAPSLTLAEQLGQSDVSVLVQWVAVSSRPNKDKGFAGATTYEVVEVVRDATQTLHAGARKLCSIANGAAQPGDLFILLGTKGANVEWASPLAVSETSYQYIKQAPSQGNAGLRNGSSTMHKFLEYPDPMVPADAYGEFANAPYKDIVPIKDAVPAR